MSSDAGGTAKGNQPELWEKLLQSLDEKLQLALLEHLRRANSYHFEHEELFIEPGSDEDEEYLKRDATFQQLQFLAHDAVGVEKVRIRKYEEK